MLAQVPKITGKPRHQHIALIRISIINKSASPISILSFRLDAEQFDFSDYSHTDPYFSISNEPSKVTFGFPDQPLDYLKPIINLEPFEGRAGYLYFALHHEAAEKSNKLVKLDVVTSRGTKTFDVRYGPSYEANESAQRKVEDPIPYIG